MGLEQHDGNILTPNRSCNKNAFRNIPGSQRAASLASFIHSFLFYAQHFSRRRKHHMPSEYIYLSMTVATLMHSKGDVKTNKRFQHLNSIAVGRFEWDVCGERPLVVTITICAGIYLCSRNSCRSSIVLI